MAAKYILKTICMTEYKLGAVNVSKGDAVKAYMYIISSHFYSPVVSTLRKLNNMASYSSAKNAKLFKLSLRDISFNVT